MPSSSSAASISTEAESGSVSNFCLMASRGGVNASEQVFEVSGSGLHPTTSAPSNTSMAACATEFSQNARPPA